MNNIIIDRINNIIIYFIYFQIWILRFNKKIFIKFIYFDKILIKSFLALEKVILVLLKIIKIYVKVSKYSNKNYKNFFV